VEAEALTGEVGMLSERLDRHKAKLSEGTREYLSGKMPKDAPQIVALLHSPANVEKLKINLFVSSGVVLEQGGKKLPPIWVNLDDGYGYAELDGKIKTSEGPKGFDPAKDVAVFYSKRGLTAAWIQTGKPLKLTLIYAVPRGVTIGRLIFQDAPPIKVPTGGR